MTGMDLPRNRCTECGYWFVTAGDETVCPDCREVDDQYEQGPDHECADTSEPNHTHICPACGDSWVHADVDCEVVYPARTWALCPMHRGGDDA